MSPRTLSIEVATLEGCRLLVQNVKEPSLKALLPNPEDPRWKEIFANWSTVQRWFHMLSDIFAEYSNGEEGQQPETCIGNQAVRPKRPRRSTPPVDAIDTVTGQHLRRIDILERYRNCQHLLSAKQWEAVYLCHGEGLTQEQMAEKLDLSRSGVSGRLTRATATMEKYEEQRREERRRLERKYREF
ncbi:MAG: sigma-70 family RNA polymerase sigma factor [Planctomycetes bacterium]|nr:sigma-70 family RNA polymerase sigma factor [Planctomycetota bacterium]